MDTKREFLGRSPEGDLGQNLVGKGARHDEGRMAGGTAEAELSPNPTHVVSSLPQIHKATFSQQNKVTTGGHSETVNLRLDIDNGLGIGLEPRNVDLDIKVADADNIMRLEFCKSS